MRNNKDKGKFNKFETYKGNKSHKRSRCRFRRLLDLWHFSLPYSTNNFDRTTEKSEVLAKEKLERNVTFSKFLILLRRKKNI